VRTRGIGAVLGEASSREVRVQARRCLCSSLDCAGSTPRGLRKRRVSSGVAAGVVGAEVDEHALNEELTDLEHVTPAAGAPVLHARAPRPERVGGGRSGSSPEPCATPRRAICGVMPRWRSRRRTCRSHSHGQRQLTLARAGVVRAGPRMGGHPATFTVSEAAVRGSRSRRGGSLALRGPSQLGGLGRLPLAPRPR
jgi:hypothetical protein